MTDVFVSYSREDRDRVEPLVRMLESLGLSVWWDREIVAGDRFDSVIDKAIQDSRCVVAVWSKTSVDSEWVRGESLEGLERGILVPVMIDPVRVPVAFRQVQAIDFTRWPYRFDDAEYEGLVNAVRHRIEGKDIASGTPSAFLKKPGLRFPTAVLTLLGLGTIAYFGIGYIGSTPSSLSDRSAVPETAVALLNDPVSYRKFLLAQDRIRRGELEDHEAAIGLLEEVTSAAPDFAEGFAALCSSYLFIYREHNDTSEYEKARHACDRALALDDANGDVYQAMAELYAFGGENDKAEATYRKAINHGASLADASIGLGFLYMKEGRIAEAEAAFNRAAETDPQSIKAQKALGAFFFLQGMYYKAGEAYERVIELEPKSAPALNNLGLANMMMGNFEEAVDVFSRALDLNRSSGADANMGYTLYLLGRFEQSAGYFQRAIDDNPSDHRLWGNLGEALRFIPGREADAQSAFEQAIVLAEENLNINPGDPGLLGRLCVYYAATREDMKARESISVARARAQNDIYVMYDIAVALSILGDTQASRQQLKDAIALGYPTVLSDADPELKH